MADAREREGGDVRILRRYLFRTIMVMTGLVLTVLLGLTSFTIQRRTKEIGIRKVLGASTTVIVRLLSTEFLILVALANVLAIPSAAWFLERWLDAFAYRIALGPGSFAFAAVLALFVVSAVMIAQALRATRLDPVQVLRDE